MSKYFWAALTGAAIVGVAGAASATVSSSTSTVAYDALGNETVGDVSATIAAGPTLTAHVGASPGMVSGTARASLTYDFSINFPDAFYIVYVPGQAQSLSIPLLITYAGSASIQAQDGQAVIDLTVRDMTGTAFEVGANCSPDGGLCGGISGVSVPFDLTYYYYGGGISPPQLNTTGEVSMLAYAQASQGVAFRADAWIDPIITIDPTFLAQNPGFSLSFDALPGAVPEPAEWAMLICGFGLVGGAMRRRATARFA